MCAIADDGPSWTLIIIPKSKAAYATLELARCCSHCNGNKGSRDLLPWYRPQLFWEEIEKIRCSNGCAKPDMDDAMIALEHSLHEKTLDRSVEELKNHKEPKKTYWDSYCAAYPSEPGA